MKRSDKKRRFELNDLSYRAAPIGSRGPKTIDEEARSVEATGATEQPVMIYDYERGEVVPEVLLMSGCKLPKSRQIPLLDTHSRHSTGDVIGSYRDMRIDGEELVGRSFYSAVPEAESAWTKTREGHLTDYSIGYRVHKSIFIPAGEVRTIDGREWKGPLRLGTSWTPKELSACPIGADDRAKARAYIDTNDEVETEEENIMDEKTRAMLVGLGMSADADEEGVRDFIAKLVTISEKAKDDARYVEPKAETPIDIEAERTEARRAERLRVSEIDSMCKKFSCPEKLRDNLIVGEKTIDEARAAIMNHILETKKEEKPLPPQRGDVPTIIADETDKFRIAAESSILLRAGLPGHEEYRKVPGASDFAGYSLIELARNSLRLANRPLGGDVRDVVGRAMTTSDFPKILQNVAHKALWLGWEGANETWSEWCDTGSVSDFKTHYSPRISEFSDLEEIAEMEEYKYGIRTEASEQYRVVTFGKLAGISRQAVINDDLNAITTNFMGMGESAARKVGDLPYAVLTANAAMGDNVALFNATHNNYESGSGSPPGIASLEAAFLAMGTQKDLQGLRRLNIRPQFFLAPYALMGPAEIFFRSEKFSDNSTAATDSTFASTRYNPYSGDTIKRIYESRLDDASVTAWYLAARKGRTVKIFFLNGIQTPYLEQQQEFTVDGTTFKVRIDAGAKAMDYRGLYCNVGT